MKKQKQTDSLHWGDDRDEQEKRKSGVEERRFFCLWGLVHLVVSVRELGKNDPSNKDGGM